MMENNWHIPDISEIEKTLGTSAGTGLLNKEARARLELSEDVGRGARRVRYQFMPVEKSTFSILVASIYTLPAVLLLLISLLTIFFGRPGTGFPLLILTVAGSLTVGVSDVLSQRRLESAGRAFLPLTRVKRGGVKGFTDCRNIVRGDVIALESGDVLPCDVRLASGKITVDELYRSGNGIQRRRVEKRADIAYLSEDDAVDYPDNMVFAGSCVVSGSAEAIAVDTRSDNYITQSSQWARGAREDSECLEGLRIDLYRATFILLAASVLFSCISLFTLASYEIASTFAMLIASVSYISFDVLRVSSKAALSSYIKRASKASKNGRDLSSYIRGVGAADKLSSLTDIVLVGGAAFNDGIYKIDSVATADGRIKDSFDMRDTAVNELFFCTYAYLAALEESGCENLYVKKGILRSLAASVKEMGFDCEGADLAIRSLYFASSEAHHGGFACAETSDGFFRTALLPSDVKPGELFGKNLLNYSKSFSERYDSFIAEQEDRGAVTLTVIKELDGKVCVAGVLSLKDTAIDICAEAKALERSGITLYAFFPEDSKRTRAILSGDGIGELINRGVAFASEITDLEDLTVGEKLPFAYVGYSWEQYISIIDALKSRGGTVACFGVRQDASPILEAADLAISCDLIDHSQKRHGEAFYEKLPPEGGEDGMRASNDTELISCVKVKRAHSGGGGLAAIQNAVFGAKRAYIGLAVSARLWLRISITVAVFAFMSVLSGTLLLSAPAALAFSAGSAAVCICAFSCAEYGFVSAPSTVCAKNYPSDILKSDIRGALARVVLGAVTSLIFALMNILELFGADAHFDGVITLCLALTLMIESAFAARALSLARGGARRAMISALTVALATVALLAGIAVLEVGLAGFFEGYIGLELVLSLVYAAAYVTVAAIFERERKAVK